MKISGFDIMQNQLRNAAPDFGTMPKSQKQQMEAVLTNHTAQGIPAAQLIPAAQNSVSPTDIDTNPRKEEQGTSLRISENGAAAVRAVRGQEQTAAGAYAPVNFSTGDAVKTSAFSDDADSADGSAAAKNTPKATAAGSADSQILNQYRFFVNTVQYEGSEGVVRRIFG